MVSPFVLVVDPGHGGPRSFGAMWPSFPADHGLTGEKLERALAEHAKTAAAVEKDINLNLALALQHALEGSGWPVLCELTRDTDEALALETRAELAAKHGADFVVVVHCDTSAERATAGLWTYVRNGDAPAMAFARDVMLATPRALRRGTNEPTIARPKPHWTVDAHAVISHYLAPAVLIECGFLSNDRDRELLCRESGQALVVAAIMAGIAGYWHRRESGNA